METNDDYTMAELLRIALGSPQLNKENLHLLHALLRYLLNRMDCECETIIVEGVEANCLKELLPHCEEPLKLTKADAYSCNIKGAKRSKKIDTLDKHLMNLEEKYAEHLSKLCECSRVKDKLFDIRMWDKYSSQNEDLCTCPGLDAREFCKFLNNGYFIFKLRHNILVPVLEKFDEFEKIIDKLNQALADFVSNTEENMNRLQMVDSITYEIAALHKAFDSNIVTYINAIEEVDDMLIAKTDRIFLPTITNCLKKNFKRAEKNIKQLRKNKMLCPKTTLIQVTPDQCLSCSFNINPNARIELKSPKRRHRECSEIKCFDWLDYKSPLEKKIAVARESAVKERQKSIVDEPSDLSLFNESIKTTSQSGHMPSSFLVNKEYTVGELLRIALGAPTLNKENLVILHAIFLFLLEKLNCRNEIVTIGGIGAECLSKMIWECRDPPMKFKPAMQINCDSPASLIDLEERALEVQEKLEKHFELIRQNGKSMDHLFSSLEWGHYTSEYEDLCRIPGVVESEDCMLVQNGYFNRHLRRNMLLPVFKNMTRLENRVEEVQKRIRRFNEKAYETHENLNLVGPLITNIHIMKTQVNENNLIFLDAVRELNEMLYGKLDRIHSPCLVNYIKKRSQFTREILKEIKQGPITCKPLKPLKISGDKCLSCGNQNIDWKKISDRKKMKVECDYEKGKICPRTFKVRTPQHFEDYEKKPEHLIYSGSISFDLDDKHDSIVSFVTNDSTSLITNITL
ncbi:hypothetical protein GQX74_004448 [Glossina fuscipes]|nr:hypothetical protein GQX74_004448 [Glossina fuscipes]